MKTRFSDKQIISILREAEAGISARKYAISDATFTPGVRGLVVWEPLKYNVLNRLNKRAPVSRSCLQKPYGIRKHYK